MPISAWTAPLVQPAHLILRACSRRSCRFLLVDPIHAPHPEVLSRSGSLEGGLQKASRSLEASFEAAGAAPQDEVRGWQERESPCRDRSIPPEQALRMRCVGGIEGRRPAQSLEQAPGPRSAALSSRRTGVHFGSRALCRFRPTMPVTPSRRPPPSCGPDPAGTCGRRGFSRHPEFSGVAITLRLPRTRVTAEALPLRAGPRSANVTM